MIKLIPENIGKLYSTSNYEKILNPTLKVHVIFKISMATRLLLRH